MKDLGTLGGKTSVAGAINNAGDVVGRTQAADGTDHAFLHRSGITTDLTTLGFPVGSDSSAIAINASGQIAVVSGSRSFLYSNGQFTELGDLGRTGTTATGINDAGQVVGRATTPSLDTHAFLYSGGTLLDLGTFGGTSAFPSAINNAGRITGTYGVPKPPDVGGIESHGFVYDLATGALRDLGDGVGAGDINDKGEFLGGSTKIGPFIDRDGTRTPLGGQGTAFALNNVGGIVGDSYFVGGLHAAIYESGGPVDLNTLIRSGSGLTLQQAFDINDSGLIVGSATTASGDIHAFLLTPIVPEPAGLSVVLLGAFSMLRRRSGV